MKRIIIFVIISFYCGILSAQVKWNFSTALQAGYNSNIYKSPEELDESDLIVNPVTSDLLRGIDLDAGVSYYITKNQRFTVDYSGSDIRYNQYPNANQYRHRLRFIYRFETSKTSTFYLSSNAVYSRKLGTNVLGEGLTRIFTSIGYGISPRFDFQISKRFHQSIEYTYREKNYRETIGYESLDYREHRALFSTQFFLKTSKLYRNLELILDYRNRRLPEYTARDILGDQQPGYPRKQYQYFTSSLGYNHKLMQHKFEIFTWFRHRKDPFQGYYSYNEYRIWSRFGGKLIGKLSFDIFASYKHRTYLNKTARQGPAIDIVDPNLIWDNMDAKTSVRYDFSRYISFDFSYILDVRDTNVADISSTTNRAYLTHAFMVAVMFQI